MERIIRISNCFTIMMRLIDAQSRAGILLLKRTWIILSDFSLLFGRMFQNALMGKEFHGNVSYH